MNFVSWFRGEILVRWFKSERIVIDCIFKKGKWIKCWKVILLYVLYIFYWYILVIFVLNIDGVYFSVMV